MYSFTDCATRQLLTLTPPSPIFLRLQDTAPLRKKTTPSGPTLPATMPRETRRF
jgi:hypothetical protein